MICYSDCLFTIIILKNQLFIFYLKLKKIGLLEYINYMKKCNILEIKLNVNYLLPQLIKLHKLLFLIIEK